jgi:hypothetical protein
LTLISFFKNKNRKNIHLHFAVEKEKKKKIRFIDDDTRDPSLEEKDTRLKFGLPKKPAVTSLQKRMLEMAGQDVPKEDSDKEGRDSSSSSDSSDDDDDYKQRRDRRDRRRV